MLVEYTLALHFVDFILDGGTSVAKESTLDCVVLCARTLGCSSIFYSRSLGSCLLSSTVYPETVGLAPQAGFTYFKMKPGFRTKCVTSAECRFQNSLCQEGICECQIGFSYDSRKESCVKRCTKYGDSFTAHRNRSVSFYNRESIRVTNPEDCMHACMKETSFVCLWVEYNRNSQKAKNCNLCKTGWFEIPESDRTKGSRKWEMYYRHCAI